MPLVLRIDLVPQYDGWVRVYIQSYRANKEHNEEASCNNILIARLRYSLSQEETFHIFHVKE